jgi:hypothetical protein
MVESTNVGNPPFSTIFVNPIPHFWVDAGLRGSFLIDKKSLKVHFLVSY